MTAFLKLLFRNRLAAMGAVVLAVIVLLALLTPILPLQDPNITNTADRFAPPFSEGYLLGADHLGRDQLSRLLWGTRVLPASSTTSTRSARRVVPNRTCRRGSVDSGSPVWSSAVA